MSYWAKVPASDHKLVAGGLPPDSCIGPKGVQPVHCVLVSLDGVANMRIRPLPVGRVNSEASIIFRSRHSKGSAEPVAIAIRGMSPSACERGNRCRLTSVRAVVVQGEMAGMVTWRRHFPIW